MTQTASNVAAPLSPGAKLAVFAGDIKIAHSLFALPFALLSTFLAARGRPRPGLLGLILLCMVAARTVAMSANRLIDARIDAQNPRTRSRAIPRGALSPAFFAGALAVCAAAFTVACGLFRVFYQNSVPLILSLPVLAFVCLYPYLKRFTRLCHYYLGAALALAPICAWLAVTGTLAAPPLYMAAAVLTWTAGFDIIYACQDYAVDVDAGLFSVPARLGISRALWVARLTHAVSAAFLILLGISTPALGTLYFLGVGAAIALLVIEHSLVGANDLSRVGLAFFTINGIISLLLGTLGIIDVYLHYATM